MVFLNLKVKDGIAAFVASAAFIAESVVIRFALERSMNYEGISQLGTSLTWLFELFLLFLALLYLFSTERLILMYDRDWKELCLSHEKGNPREQICFLLRNSHFAIDLAFLSALWGITCVVYALSGGVRSFGIRELLILLLQSLTPILFAAILLAVRADTYRAFHILRKKKTSNRYGKKHFSVRFPRIAFVLLFVRNAILFVLGAIVLPIVASMVVGLVGIALRLPIYIYIVLATIFLLAVGASYLRALLKRRSFMKRLERVCSANRYELFDVNRVYRSLFRSSPAANFSLQRGRERYDCKLISGRRRTVQIAFSENGKAAYVRSLRIGMGGRAGGGRVVRMPRTELLRVETPFDYSFPSEGRKILIVNPVPGSIVFQFEGTKRNVDVGEKIGEYFVYNASGFLNAAERGCLGKRQGAEQK